MPKITRQLVLQADRGRSADIEDWKAVVAAIIDAARNEIEYAKQNAYNQATTDRKESTDQPPSAPTSAASQREKTA